jgi:hypothetical protein
VIVELDGRRSACWAMREIDGRRAVAALGDGFLVALLPDAVTEVTFVIGQERDTYAVTDNVVVGNLDGAKPGATLELLTGTATPPGCGGATVEDAPLAGELLVALPIFGEANAAALPKAVADRLAEAGARRMRADDARRLDGDGASEAWVVSVADSRFAECGDPLVVAPRSFEGPGACLAIVHDGELKTALCADLDDLAGGIVSAAVPGGRVAGAFLPHGATGIEIEGTVLPDADPPHGVVFGAIPDRERLSYDYPGVDDPGDMRSRTVMVLAADEPLAQDAHDRLVRAGVDLGGVAHGPEPERSRVMYAAGMARPARQVAEVLRVQDVLPLDPATAEAAGSDADVVVVLGRDVRR